MEAESHSEEEELGKWLYGERGNSFVTRDGERKRKVHVQMHDGIEMGHVA